MSLLQQYMSLAHFALPFKIGTINSAIGKEKLPGTMSGQFKVLKKPRPPSFRSTEPAKTDIAKKPPNVG